MDEVIVEKNVPEGPRNDSRGEKLLREGFEAGLILKGVDAALEIAGGILVRFLSPKAVNSAVLFLMSHELAEDPRDKLANYFISLAHHFTIGTQAFAFLYLISHGVVKLVLVVAVLAKRLWAYPALIGFLVLFIGYQLYRFTYSHDIAWILLSIFDAVIAWLVWHEYGLMKRRFAAERAS